MTERTRPKMGQKTITEFLDREYREFALYSIQNRAIASVIDGFKPVARKIVFTSSKIWKTSGQKPMKIFQLSGKVSSESFYHHGSSSLDSAIIQMAQRFKNNLPLLEEHGQFGSLRSTEASAPRYIATRLSPIFWSLYKDERLLDYLQEEGQEIEPRFYLPIIPTILVNGGSGIAVGFSSNILNRPALDVLEAVIGVIEGKEIQPLTPSINGFVGNFIRDMDNPKRWIIRGVFKHLSKFTTQILEIPPSFTWEKYEELLDDLTQKGIIQSWEDNCKEDINYTVRWTTQSQGFLSDDEWVTKCLKLEEYWWYEKRKKLLIQDIEKEILQISQRVRFIKCVISGEIHIMNVPKKTLNDRLVELEFIKIDGSYEYLLRLPISSLVKEVWEKLQLELEEKKRERETLIQKTIKGMYLSDLLQLKKDLKAKQI
ncbi:hypothetical protein EBU71_06265 [bacterium]|nr:hypothetical protein [Candidatus Elulimicrobium humile]